MTTSESMPVALVTGAGRGIGRAVAVRLSEAGYRVALTSRSADELEAVAKACPGPALVRPCDITDASAVEDLFAGYFETVLEKNELISAVRIPPQGASRSAYMKVTTGSAEDWPALGVAIRVERDASKVKSARVVVSAATEKAARLNQCEQTLAGAPIEEKTYTRAGEAAAAEVECISDVRGSAAYKRELVRVFVGRTLRQALENEGPTR